MKYFLITRDGESGPFTAAQLNRMFAQRKIVADQLCRREDSTISRRLDEEFRHMQSSGTSGVAKPIFVLQKKPVSKPVLILVLIGTLWIWISYLQFRPPLKSDYESIRGALISVNEYQMKRAIRLDIRIKENSARFSVDPALYRDYFERERFFSEVPLYSEITLWALRSEIANPSIALLGSEPTVWVCGVEANNRAYVTLDDYIAQRQHNHRYHLGFAIALTAIFAFLVNTFLKDRKNVRSDTIGS